jgi:hypothetical protein
MPILLAGTIEIVHIEQVSALFTFRLGQVLLYYDRQSVGQFILESGTQMRPPPICYFYL